MSGLQIPDPASSFHNVKDHPSHTYPSPLPLLVKFHCPYCHQSKFYLLEAMKSSTSSQHLSRACLLSSLYHPAGEHPVNPAHDIHPRRFYWSKQAFREVWFNKQHCISFPAARVSSSSPHCPLSILLTQIKEKKAFLFHIPCQGKWLVYYKGQAISFYKPNWSLTPMLSLRSSPAPSLFPLSKPYS